MHTGGGGDLSHYLPPHFPASPSIQRWTLSTKGTCFSWDPFMPFGGSCRGGGHISSGRVSGGWKRRSEEEEEEEELDDIVQDRGR